MNSIPDRLADGIAEPRPYYVWNSINAPEQMMWFGVASPEEGARKIKQLAQEQLQNEWIHDNAFGLICREDGEWVDWYSEDGEDIKEWAERMGI